MKKGLLCAALLLLLPFNAFADNWQFVDLGKPDVQTFVDLESIKPQGQLVYYWQKRLIVSENDPVRKQYGKRAALVKTYAVDDCRNAMIKPLYTNVMDSEGQAIDFYHNTEHPEPINRWGITEEFHQFICSRKP